MGSAEASPHLSRTLLAAGLVAILWIFTLPAAQAHKPSDAYLRLKTDGAEISGQMEIAIRDLDAAIGLDADGDGDITWGELRGRHPAIADYARARLSVSDSAGSGTLHVLEQLVAVHAELTYAVLRFRVDAARPGRTLTLRYELLFDVDPLHRGLASVEHQGRTSTLIFSPESQRQQVNLAALQPGRELWVFLREGIRHIWMGFDHILFLFCLLLPSVLERRAARWVAVGDLSSAIVNVLKVVTAFTVAHSMTLSLAALGLVAFRPRLIEAAIAASVVIAALNNLWPFLGRNGWLIAFGFGLIHGFGFATVLSELGLERGVLAWRLVGFNLGVEIGQLIIVLVFVPVAFRVRAAEGYQTLLLRTASVGMVLVGGAWLGERLLDVKWLPF